MGDNDNILEDYISYNSIEKLNNFSDLANKNSAAAHSLDEERWMNFIISAFEEGRDLSTVPLGEWFEAEGWSEEKAFDLIRQFEFGIFLLNQYRSFIDL